MCSGVLYGQAADTALIVGTVTDVTGAVIPGTSITFAHLAKGTEYSAQSNESGSFRSPPLRIEEYIIVTELTDIRETAFYVANVPTPDMKGGNFGAYDRAIHDPMTLANGTRQAFPNNIIPQERFDPVTNIMRNWWPDPQREGLTRNHTFQPPRNQDFHKWDLRWDHNLTNLDNLFAGWSSQQQVVNNPPRLPPTEFGSLTRGGTQDVTSNNAVVGWNRIWSPLLVSNLRVGWNYIDTDIETRLDIPDNVNARIGLQGFNQDLRGVSEMSMSPWYPIGTNTFRPNLIQSQTRQFSADNTLRQGDHAIKFGAQLFFLQSFIDNPQRTMGTIIFDGRFTEQSPTARGGGDALGDFLLGYPREMFDRTPST